MYRNSSGEIRERFEDTLKTVEHSEWQNWINHPCGRALKLLFEGTATTAFEEWINDGDIDPDIARESIRLIEMLGQEIFVDGLYAIEEELNSKDD